MVRGSGNPVPDHYGTVWDPLRGVGPSSVEHYYDPLEKRSPHFPSKPGWKSLRHQADIKQDHQRLQDETVRADRQARGQATARQRALDRHLNHGFNPVTGQEYNKTTGSWQAAADPWAHHRPTLRPQHTIEASEQLHSTQRQTQQRQEALAPVVQMRKERIANGGLSAVQRRHGGVAELLNWGS